MTDLPSHPSALTFLFTDIEGSTRLWEEEPEAMRLALAHHDDLLRSAIESYGGRVFKTIGDAFCATFVDPGSAVEAVLACQEWLPALALRTADGVRPLRVRMALHTGPAEMREGDYFGPTLNRLARLLSAGHGGQVLLSGATAELLGENLPGGAGLLDRGSHRLKDLQQPEQVFQICHTALETEFPPLRTLSSHPNNLPQQATSFIGREREIEKVKELLGVSRLVTLTGTGGTGKTRLALQAAAELLESYPDGIWLVELAPLSNPMLVAQAAASVLSLEQEAGKPLTGTLVEHLRARQMLLVLDNCEHLLEPAAALSEAILRDCPRVRILATSREFLRVGGEAAHRVSSLSLPDLRTEASPELLSQYESTRLFIERATHFASDFAVTSRNSPALLSICRRLDGIPLAIELAAARARSLSVEDVNQRLDQRFRLLTGGSRTALPRQQTLRSLIDWSYDLLSGREQALLQRLSVFAGGWTLDAAERVCTGGDIEEWDVVDLMTSLSDKSLLVREEPAASTRYRFLETVRQYARDRAAENGDGSTWRGRHLDHFLALAEEAQSQLAGQHQAGWLQRLEGEHDNLRAALEWSREEGNSAEPGFRLAAAIWRFWMMRGFVSEGRRQCSLLLETYPNAPPSVGLGGVLHAAGNLALLQSELAAARELYERAIAVRREVGDSAGEAGSIGNLATLAQHEGDLDGARRGFEESLGVFEAMGDENGLAISLTCLGTVAQSQNDYSAAREFLIRALFLNRRIGNRAAEANVLNNLGCVERSAGDPAAAQRAYHQALSINRDLGFAWEAALNLINLAVYSRSMGDLETAQSQLSEVLHSTSALGQEAVIVECLHQWAHLEFCLGRYPRSVRLFGVAHAGREALSLREPETDLQETEAAIAALREALGESVFDHEHAVGRGMGIEAAVEFALLRH